MTYSNYTTDQLVEAARGSDNELTIALGEALAAMDEHCVGEMTREAMILSSELARAQRIAASTRASNALLISQLDAAGLL